MLPWHSKNLTYFLGFAQLLVTMGGPMKDQVEEGCTTNHRLQVPSSTLIIFW